MTAPFDPQVDLARASLGLAAWSSLDGETRALVGGDLAGLLSGYAEEEVVAAADEIGRRRELREALAGDTEAAARLADTERRLRGSL